MSPKKLPPHWIAAIRSVLQKNGLIKRKYETEFSQIYSSKYWSSQESVSGGGSSIASTKEIRCQLPILLKKYRITSLLDVPCGDFHWMSKIDLTGVSYTGGDIVKEVISANVERYRSAHLKFLHADIIHERLPYADCVFCRDCLVHLPLYDCLKALDNFVRSGSKYLLATTFTGQKHNADIAAGKWRPLNLQIAPFFFPEAMEIIDEQCTDDKGKFADKSMGLWKLSDIQIWPHAQ
jgi:SAM-dependent methyltransferase